MEVGALSGGRSLCLCVGVCNIVCVGHRANRCVPVAFKQLNVSSNQADL